MKISTLLLNSNENERDSTKTSLLCLIVERKINPFNSKINWIKNVLKIAI